jgi:hypothetical protein
MIAWLSLLAALAATGSGPRLGKADLDDASALFMVPDGQPLRAKLTRRLGTPTRLDGNQAIWEAHEGTACWRLTLLGGPDDKDGIMEPPTPCAPARRYNRAP